MHRWLVTYKDGSEIVVKARLLQEAVHRARLDLSPLPAIKVEKLPDESPSKRAAECASRSCAGGTNRDVVVPIRPRFYTAKQTGPIHTDDGEDAYLRRLLEHRPDNGRRVS